MTPHNVLVAAIAGTTFLLMLVRPGDKAEGIYAAIGALGMVIVGAVPLGDVPNLIGDTGDVLAFLAGMLLVTGIVERTAVFPLIAEQCARWSRGSGFVMFVLLYVVAVGVTTFLSLDVTVILLPPIVVAVSRRWSMNPIPALFACVFAANTVSLALPVSNLTNLLMVDRLHLAFADFARQMVLPNLVAAVVLLALLTWQFKVSIPPRIVESPTVERPGSSGWTLWCAIVLAGALVALTAFGFAGWPLWWASVPAALILVATSLFTDRARVPVLLTDLSLPVFLFVISMAVIVDAIQRTWLDGRTVPLPAHPGLAFSTAVGLNALGSNIVNNIPMTLVSAHVIDTSQSTHHQLLAYGSLVGANIGPALTTYGSLATILWFTAARRAGISISGATYLRASVRIVLVVLIATAVTTWLVVH